MDNQFVSCKNINQNTKKHLCTYIGSSPHIRQHEPRRNTSLTSFNGTEIYHTRKKSLYKIRFFLSFAFCHSLQLQLIYRHALNLSPHLFFCSIFVSLSRLQMNNKSDFICLYIYAMLSHTSNKWCLTSSSCGDFFFSF